MADPKKPLKGRLVEDVEKLVATLPEGNDKDFITKLSPAAQTELADYAAADLYKRSLSDFKNPTIGLFNPDLRRAMGREFGAGDVTNLNNPRLQQAFKGRVAEVIDQEMSKYTDPLKRAYEKADEALAEDSKAGRIGFDETIAQYEALKKKYAKDLKQLFTEKLNDAAFMEKASDDIYSSYKKSMDDIEKAAKKPAAKVDPTPPMPTPPGKSPEKGRSGP